MNILVMGVSGVGKTSVAKALATALNLPFVDADDLHTAANRAKMAAGKALNDDDRWPWLATCAAATTGDVVLACSALKRSYRDHLRAGVAGPLHIIHLTAPRAVIAERLAARKGHFMPATLLDSQLATLEAPGPHEALTIGADQPMEQILDAIRASLGAMQQSPNA